MRWLMLSKTLSFVRICEDKRKERLSRCYRAEKKKKERVIAELSGTSDLAQSYPEHPTGPRKAREDQVSWT